jgi:dihydropyrimidinase
MVHCEDGEMISTLQQEYLSKGMTHAAFHALSHPPEAEIRAVEQVLALCGKTGCPVYIVHVSTAQAAIAIREAKRSGLPVFAETCIQYLMLNGSVYDQTLDNLEVLPYVISPPLRTDTDRERLWEGLADGTFDTVATDHCPFNLHGQKDKGLDDFTKIPNGAGGIEHRLPMLYTYGVFMGRISVNRFAALVSARPAEIFGWSGRKGRLEPGYDADIVIWDPEKRSAISVKNHFQHCDSEIYEGIAVRGKPSMVIVNGMIACHKGVLDTRRCRGRYLP